VLEDSGCGIVTVVTGEEKGDRKRAFGSSDFLLVPLNLVNLL